MMSWQPRMIDMNMLMRGPRGVRAALTRWMLRSPYTRIGIAVWGGAAEQRRLMVAEQQDQRRALEPAHVADRRTQRVLDRVAVGREQALAGGHVGPRQLRVAVAAQADVPFVGRHAEGEFARDAGAVGEALAGEFQGILLAGCSGR